MITSEQYRELLKRSGVVAGRIPTPGISVLKSQKKPVAGRTGARKVRQKTKVEADFELMLRADWPQMTILYEQVKVQIDESCWYLPDFYIPQLQTFFECKGAHMWEDSLIEFKAARRIHSWATWQMHQYKNGAWKRLH